MTKEISISFDHGFRVNIDVQIAATTENKIGWRINMHGNSGVIKAAKKEIFEHTVHYLERRIRKSLVKISFDDIMLLTKAKPIKSVSRNIE